jgi:prepilin-type N-terminal cleavage/methylation domain-containing protein
MRTLRRGFTLVEVIIAMALVGLVLVAMNTFVFSMGELWGRNGEVRLFDQHVRAVTRFLQRELRTAALPPAGVPNSAPIGVSQVRPETGISDNLRTFTLLSGSRMITWPDRGLPEVVCSLQVRQGQGLVLLWHSDLESHFTEDPPRETLLTPYATSLAYDYFDPSTSRWSTENTVRKDNTGNAIVPQRLRLGFSYAHMTRETFVDLPTTPQGLPVP